MIHKLYVNVAGWSMLDFDSNKKIVLDTMKYDNEHYKHTHYLLVSEDKYMAPEIKTFLNQEDIDNYLEEYNKNINSKTLIK